MTRSAVLSRDGGSLRLWGLYPLDHLASNSNTSIPWRGSLQNRTRGQTHQKVFQASTTRIVLKRPKAEDSSKAWRRKTNLLLKYTTPRRELDAFGDFAGIATQTRDDSLLQNCCSLVEPNQKGSWHLTPSDRRRCHCENSKVSIRCQKPPSPSPDPFYPFPQLLVSDESIPVSRLFKASVWFTNNSRGVQRMRNSLESGHGGATIFRSGKAGA